MFKKLLCCFMCAVMLFALCACAGSPASEKAATVNGVDIMKSEVEALVESTAQMYIAFGADEDTFYGDEESRAALYEGALQALIERRLTIDVAQEQGQPALTAEERAAFEQAGQKELQLLVDSAKNNETDLSAMLAMLGSTEENYVSNYVAIAEYSRAVTYLTELAEPEEAEYQAYFERMVQSQIDSSSIDPSFLGNYLEQGTLLYAPEGSVYIEYIVLADGYDADKDFVALLSEHQEDAEYGNAVVFPGSTQFPEAVTTMLLSLEAGEDTGRLDVNGKGYKFQRMGDYTLPASWETMPDSMKANVQRTAGDAYIADLVAAANNDEHVTLYE